MSLAVMRKFENHLYQAVDTYRGGLLLAGDDPQRFENLGFTQTEAGSAAV